MILVQINTNTLHTERRHLGKEDQMFQNLAELKHTSGIYTLVMRVKP